MTTFDHLQTCLCCLIERNYYLDKWIGGESLLSILDTQYHLIDVTKKYLNQHLPKYPPHVYFPKLHWHDNLNYGN